MLEEWEDAQKVVLGYLYNVRTTVAFNKALTRIQKQFFSGKRRLLWRTLFWYFSQTSGLPDLDQFRKFIRAQKGTTEELLLDLESHLTECQEAAQNVDEAGFTWHMGRLSEVYRSIKFDESLVKAQDDLDKVGYVKAKQVLLKDMSNIEIGGIDMSQDGNVLVEAGELYKEIGSAKDIRTTQAIDFGLPSLDNKLLGVRRGEFLIIAAWTGAGKTSLCVNTAVYSSCVQKRNVVFVTTETTRDPLRRRIFARMSKLPVFEENGYLPISSQTMKSGELTPADRKTMDAMKGWLESTDLGVLEVVQAPAFPSCAWLRGKLLQLESQYPIDLVIMDDIRSLVPPVRRRQEYEELTLIVRDMKAIARTHANRGVPLISPHHINREMYKRMIDPNSPSRRMNVSGMSGASEVEKRADIILGLWYDADDDPHMVRGDLLKVRDGPAGESVDFGVQWEYQYFYVKEGGSGFVPE